VCQATECGTRGAGCSVGRAPVNGVGVLREVDKVAECGVCCGGACGVGKSAVSGVDVAAVRGI